jgi:cellulose synthase/poly-beta-1,6-N-acetylglucosamine synthase-like glycosyltransferase
MIFNVISGLFLFFITLCEIYLWCIALSSIKPLPKIISSSLQHRFAIAIPAHNEANVIGNTVATLRQLNYPRNLFDIYVVADFCTDLTAQISQDQGAICFERANGERGGKGSALSYLFEQIFDTHFDYDAVVVFDADTRVDRNFLQVMNARLNQGALVIQGRHVISNPHMGWFPALSWAMMTIDNRYSNHGRMNLKLSAKHMGDSICIRTNVLKKSGWGQGLTEDYEFRLKLLLDRVQIQYEPNAIGYGQAPLTINEAHSQRLRWIKGMIDAKKLYRHQLVKEGIKNMDWSMLDGAISNTIPSYSVLTMISVLNFIISYLFPAYFWHPSFYIWGGVTLLWLLYPLLGLLLEKSPGWAYLAILTGPIQILWRTWLSLYFRFAPTHISWIRTPHH